MGPQNDYLDALHETALALMNRLDLDALLETIVARAARLVGTAHGYLYLIEDGHAEIRVGVGLFAKRVGFRVRHGEGVGGTVWQSGQPLIVQDVQTWPGRTSTFDYDNMHAVVGVPLKAGGEVVGVIGLAFVEPPHAGLVDQIEMLERFAELASLALFNARLYTNEMEAYQLLEQRVDERTRELASMLEIAHNFAATLELEPLLRLALDQLKVVAEYSGASVFTLEGHDLVVLDYRVPPGHEEALRLRLSLEQAGANRAVFERREPVIIGDVRGDTALAHAFQATAGEALATRYSYIRSWMGVPLIVREHVIGMLTLDAPEPDYFTPRHAALVLAIANQVAVAIENARLFEQAQMLAVMEERQRLARELHDSVSQALYGIQLGARTARELLASNPQRAASSLDYVISLAQGGAAEMRALIFELRPEALATEGLVAALTRHATSLQARYGIDVQTTLGAEPEVSLAIKEALYRVAQESMHNIVKHAQARHASVVLQQADGMIRLEICDDGVGFDPSAAYPGHLGLRSMRERIARAGGRLAFDSTPGRGTCIRAEAPATDRR